MLRVLDLGAHDGFVDFWIAQQLPAGAVHIDGIELHPLGVETFNRRLAELGVPGKCKQGLADNASELFQPGSYDAVVAFEIIEHVPDPAGFLRVCESMLKPGGQVYVSTPDGCFGTGHNPHHLRAMRSIDLADLLRRRGRLLDMELGPDGISSARYTPQRKPREASIYVGPGWQKWSARDHLTKGLGGSETAVIHVANELAKIGWVVTVYGDVEEGVFGDVIYRHHDVFDPLERVDLLIASRMPHVFDRPHRARRAFLWMHDTDLAGDLTPARAGRIDEVLVLSRWHERHVLGRYPFLHGQVRRTRNGIDFGRFDGEPLERAQRVVYSSSPDRGLDVLLELWPQIRERVPGALLTHTYSPVYWEVADRDPVVGAHAARVRALSIQPGVEAIEGGISQPAVAMLMRESLVWVAPSFNTPYDAPFHETSCIGAMEAQAAGCHVVASNWGALPETVKVGALVDGPPMSDRWRDAFLEEIVSGLTDRAVQARAQAEGPAHAQTLGWGPVAEQLAAIAVGQGAG